MGHRHGSDLALLCLWHRPVATTLIRPLAWETPSAEGAALKGQKQTNKKTKQEFPCGPANQISGVVTAVVASMAQIQSLAQGTSPCHAMGVAKTKPNKNTFLHVSCMYITSLKDFFLVSCFSPLFKNWESQIL